MHLPQQLLEDTQKTRFYKRGPKKTQCLNVLFSESRKKQIWKDLTHFFKTSMKDMKEVE